MDNDASAINDNRSSCRTPEEFARDMHLASMKGNQEAARRIINTPQHVVQAWEIEHD